MQNGFTPLHLASQEGHTDIVSLLLEKDANVNAKAHVSSPNSYFALYVLMYIIGDWFIDSKSFYIS